MGVESVWASLSSWVELACCVTGACVALCVGALCLVARCVRVVGAECGECSCVVLSGCGLVVMRVTGVDERVVG